MLKVLRSYVVCSLVVLGVLALGACGQGGGQRRASHSALSANGSVADVRPPAGTLPALGPTAENLALPGMPRLLNASNVYAADRAEALAPDVRYDRPLVYVPNSGSATVEEIDPRTYRVVRQFPVGSLPQHVVPSWDLRTLWVTNDIGNSLTPIDPRSGVPGRPVPVVDPYNMYFTPDGRFAVVMAERLRDVDFRDAQTMRLRHVLPVPACNGVNHADFTADGRVMFASCEYGASMIEVDVARQSLLRMIPLPAGSSPQDVKLSPDGRIFYVADLFHGGVWLFSADDFRRIGFLRTGAGAHGLYPSRDAQMLYVSNRGAGTISVVSFAKRRVIRTWTIPGGGSPDMGGVSASGRVLWLSGRYDAVVYAIDTRTGHLIRKIPVGFAPHGLCVFPQPGRYSLGHTGIMR